MNVDVRQIIQLPLKKLHYIPLYRGVFLCFFPDRLGKVGGEASNYQLLFLFNFIAVTKNIKGFPAQETPVSYLFTCKVL